MKKYTLTLITLSLITISLNAQRTTDNAALKKQTEINQRSTDNQSLRNQTELNQRTQNTQKQDVIQSTVYPQYIFVLITETFSGKITKIEVSGEISFENVEIKTREDKEKIMASLNASKEFEKAQSIAHVFEIANRSFTFENHNIVQLDKELKHYILFSTK